MLAPRSPSDRRLCPATGSRLKTGCAFSSDSPRTNYNTRNLRNGYAPRPSFRLRIVPSAEF
jgi:hypothetical protein